ncbi:CAP domain-containing protein [Halobacillus amylolyticus]|uniref:CAP domain-containing protein n=1 Tax=Halobacillus amylolyticus TaxID=2932259 RepID=A0ABY4H8G3_9BACI|nr:CAP domain-containing protein [Halobacillus amylolyticus]UOR10230.1 CAP domain-containing protein [Halobacillus amylolyticus]
MKSMSFILSGAVAASLLFAPANTQASTVVQKDVNIDCVTGWHVENGDVHRGNVQSILKQIELAQFGMQQTVQVDQSTEQPEASQKADTQPEKSHESAKAEQQLEKPDAPAKAEPQQKKSDAPTKAEPQQEKSDAPTKAEPQPTEPAEQPTQAQAQPKPQPQENTQQSAENSSVSAFEKKVVELTNAERAQEGLAPLELDVELSKVAKDKSLDMQQNDYFSHTSPTYGSPFDMMKQYGIDYTTAGENIAMGQTSPEQVVQGWMNSQGHRENIMNPSFTHIGVGYAEQGNYWTQMFIGK